MLNILVDADKFADVEKLWWEWNRRLEKEQGQNNSGGPYPRLISLPRSIKSRGPNFTGLQIPKTEVHHLPEQFLDFLDTQRFPYEVF